MIVIPCCDQCIHLRKEKIDGYKVACDAFPNGIPGEHLKKDIEHLKECNNSIGFETSK